MPPTTRLLSMCGRYQAWVVVDGKEAEIYEAKGQDNGKVMECYIEAVEGKEFKILSLGSKTQDLDEWPSLATRVWVDSLHIKHCHGPPTKDTIIDAVQTSRFTCRQLTFGAVELSEVGEKPTAQQQAELGCIKVTIKRFKPVSDSYGDYSGYPADKLWDSVNESSKKSMLSNLAELGPALFRVDNGHKTDGTHPAEDQGEFGVATFIFKYRNREVLKAMEIIENPQQISAKEAQKKQNELAKKKPIIIDNSSDAEPESEVEKKDKNKGKGKAKAKVEPELEYELEAKPEVGNVDDIDPEVIELSSDSGEPVEKPRKIAKKPRGNKWYKKSINKFKSAGVIVKQEPGSDVGDGDVKEEESENEGSVGPVGGGRKSKKLALRSRSMNIPIPSDDEGIEPDGPAKAKRSNKRARDEEMGTEFDSVLQAKKPNTRANPASDFTSIAARSTRSGTKNNGRNGGVAKLVALFDGRGGSSKGRK